MLGPQAVAIAKRYLGIPYVWGGSTPTGGFDCSGLMMYVYRQLGITLDHYAAWQFLEGTRIAPQDLQPGDLVFFEPKADGPGHVGMYVGDGKMINAPHTGDVVRIVSIQGRSGYVGAVRPVLSRQSLERVRADGEQAAAGELHAHRAGDDLVADAAGRAGLERVGVQRPAHAGGGHARRAARPARAA